MPSPTAPRWEPPDPRQPLADAPRQFAARQASPAHRRYLTTILSRCPPGGRTLEAGIHSGLDALWLSLRDVQAEGVSPTPPLVERARQVNNLLGGNARFRVADPFQLYPVEAGEPPAGRYAVLHHQSVLEHFPVPWIHALLAQQVALADWVVFQVPSVYVPGEPEHGDERLLPLEEWGRILAPFDVAQLDYDGDPPQGERASVRAVLRGQPADAALRVRMRVPDPPYPPGLSAIVHTRNEAARLADCLATLQGWTDEILVCDMESTDATVEIARRYTDQILPHPYLPNFDRARNVSAMRARYAWVFYLDADERVPPGLGPLLRHLTLTEGERFEALLPPFRHLFAGHWLRCLYPGYTAPRLLKNGRFVFHARLHAGAQVDGVSSLLSAENPDLALVHHSYDSLAHYLEKLNHYTDGEALNMWRDGQPFHWQRAIRHFVEDFQAYYRRGAPGDGVHGFLYAFLSAFYRFEQHAKLYELRFRHQQLEPPERETPATVRQILEYALQVADEKPLPPPAEVRVQADDPAAAPLLWSGPLRDPSGYGEESRHLLAALAGSGLPVAAQVRPWSHDAADLTARERQQLEEQAARPVAPGFVQVVHDFAPRFARHPAAGVAIGRTTFETDRLPPDWVAACHRMDYVWVPSAFNQRTFAQAGVPAERLVVIPECFDPAPYDHPEEPTGLAAALAAEPRFVFLSVFDWTLHKGWDALLRAFLEAFEGREDVRLVLKVWSTMGYRAADIEQQAAAYVERTLGHDLRRDARVRFVSERFSRAELIALYRACDAYVLPSRGEGWGRPYMEAMACGKPVIATRWSGPTAYLTDENSYLVDVAVVPVPEAGWREIPTYRGHRWAEPDPESLRQALRRVVAERGEAAAVGERAREQVTAQYDLGMVGRQMAAQIARVREERAPHPVPVSLPVPREGTPHSPDADRVASRESSPDTAPDDPITLRWEGTPFVWHSLAHVNRELCRALLARGDVELALVPIEPHQFAPGEDPRFRALADRCFAPLSRPADVHVRHFFPPRLDPPAEGRLVLMQPWEYGYLPADWIEPIRQHVAEVWCYSRFVRDVYRASGIPEEKLQVVPLGVDPAVFSPDAPPYVFTTEPGAVRLDPAARERFVFLYVGGTLERKGIDLLLEAYLKAFSAFDDVCLLVKDMATRTVYRGQNARERLLELAGDRTRPALVYLEDDLTAAQLAGVYTAADCLVQPYRGEGFCLPALEAMACGRPVIVPAGGPTDDFVDESVGWRLPAERRPYGHGRIGEWDCVGPTWVLEVAVETLARQMRQVYHDCSAVQARGAAAARRAREGWTWEQAAEVVSQRLQALRTPPRAEADGHRNDATAPPPTAPPARKETRGSPPKAKKARARANNLGSRAEPAAKTAPSAGNAPAKTAPIRPMPTISLCMIVRDEERVLTDGLESARPYVDEMIVVDTGSTDRTVEIARAHGATVFSFPWCDDFAAARNESLKHATGDWIFWMDADDTLPAACGAALHPLVFQAPTRVSGYLLQVHFPPAPGEHGFTVVDHVKLFRSRPEHRFEGRIHEQILESLSRTGGVVERTDLYVVHSGYDHSPEGQRKKRERDLRILDKELADKPNHPFVWFCIGMTAFHLRDFARATAALERCLALSRPRESTLRKVYAMLTGCGLEQRRLEEARHWLEQGLARFPHDPELLFRAGVLYRELGDPARAEESYLRLLTAREVGHIDSLDVSMTTYKAHHNLALLYQDLGRLDAAEAQWRAAVERQPDFTPAWIALGELYLRQGRIVDGRRVLVELTRHAPAEAARLRARLDGV